MDRVNRLLLVGHMSRMARDAFNLYGTHIADAMIEDVESVVFIPPTKTTPPVLQRITSLPPYEGADLRKRRAEFLRESGVVQNVALAACAENATPMDVVKAFEQALKVWAGGMFPDLFLGPNEWKMEVKWQA